MKNYEASVLYDANTLKKMGKIQIYSRVIHNFVYLAMCIILIIAGLCFGVRTMTGLFCIAAGGIGIPLLGSVVRTRTDNIIKALGNNTIPVDYLFDPTGISVSTADQQNRFRYSDLNRIWKDADFYYLFYGKIDVLMISIQSLEPGEPAAFEKELAEATGLTWYRYTSPIMFNLNLLVSELKRAMQSK